MKFELRPGEVILQKEQGITCGENKPETIYGTLYLTNQRVAFAVLSEFDKLLNATSPPRNWSAPRSEFMPFFAGNDIVWEADLNEITKFDQPSSYMFMAYAICTPTAKYSFIVNGREWLLYIKDAVSSIREIENTSRGFVVLE